MDARRHSPFGDTLRRFREAAALSQEELAERAGLSVRGISDLERGVRTTPRLETVRMLADGLRLDESGRLQLLEARNRTPQTTPLPPGRGALFLPKPVTSFVGRDQDVAEIERIVTQDHARLLTLTGPGGVGKTRVAIEAAHRLADAFAGGVVFIDVSPVRSPELVLPTIASRLGVSEQGSGDIRDALLVALQDRHLLLVLDNLEQVVEAATDVAWLHASFPELVMIATSRVRLRVAAEQMMPIEPLAVPTDDDLGALQQVDAVTLFVARANAVDPGFKLSNETAATIAEIVTKLQGMPLAIELAAARIRLLSVTDLLHRLSTQLSVLGGGARDVPPRQRTMRDTISWSYNLLLPTEQAVFRTLAIFPDGCTLETAVAVLTVGDRFSEVDIMDAVGTLVDSSMLRRRMGPNGEVRFLMLQTLQEFGLELLAVAREESVVRRAAHESWVIPLAHEAEFVLSTPRPDLWLDQVGAEYQNLRSHISWLLEHDYVEEALDAAIALATFNSIRGQLEDSRQLLEVLLDHPRLRTSTVGRMRGLIALGILCKYQADAQRSFVVLQESAQLARELDQQRHIPVALYNLAIAMADLDQAEEAEVLFNEVVTSAQGNTNNFTIAAAYRKLARLSEYRGHEDEAHRLALESLNLGLAEGHTWNVALAELFLGEQLVLKGDVDQAEKLILDAQLLLDQLGHRALSPYLLTTLADIARRRQDLDRAEELLQESLGMARDLGIRREIALILYELGYTALLKGNVNSAQVFACRTIEWCKRFGDIHTVIRCLDLAADLALLAGDAQRAAWCIGAVEAVSAGHSMGLPGYQVGEHQARIDSIRSVLGDDDWQSNYDRAFAMSEHEILTEMKSWLGCRKTVGTGPLGFWSKTSNRLR